MMRAFKRMAGLALLLIAAGANAHALKLAVSRGPVSLPIYVAEARGLFQREGVAVETVECASGRQCFRLLSEGAADLATAAELVVTLDGLGDSQAAIVATISASARHIKLVARRSAGISTPADLRGKRIGTAAGTSAQYFLDSWLLYHDIDPGAHERRSLPPDQLAGALERQELDAAAIWEPVAHAAAQGLGRDALVMQSARIYTQHFSLVALRAGLARQEAATLGVLRALAAAQRIIETEPEKARQLLAAKLGVEVSPASLAEHDFKLALNQSLVSTMDAQTRWALREGLGPAGAKPASVLRLVEPALLRKAVPAAVTLVP